MRSLLSRIHQGECNSRLGVKSSARNVILLLLSLAVLPAGATTGRSAIDVERGAVFLYQPDAPLRARLESAQDLTAHIKRLQAAGTAFFASERTHEKLDVVVGVKPGKKVRVWLISSRRSSADKTLVLLRRKLEAIPPCTVHEGPVAFALVWTINGTPAEIEAMPPCPIPKEWRDAAAGKNIQVPKVLDGVLARVWKD